MTTYKQRLWDLTCAMTCEEQVRRIENFPDVLAALRAIAACEFVVPPYLIERARAAIAKAEGQS